MRDALAPRWPVDAGTGKVLKSFHEAAAPSKPKS